jgi:hypothetical protein
MKMCFYFDNCQKKLAFKLMSTKKNSFKMHKREKSLNEFELQILHIDCLYLYIVVGTDLIIKSGKVGVIDCLYLYIVVGTDLIIKSGKVGVSLNGYPL